VGTIEPGRSWYRDVKRFRMKQRFEEFDEFYAKVRRAGYRRVMRRIARRFLRKGFGGLFLDNTDMVELFPRQRRGMRKLTRSLSRLTHGRDRLLFTQNGDETIGPLLRFYDGWNREDVTWTFNFDRRRYQRVPAADHRQAVATLKRISAKGLLTMATDYTAGDRRANDESVRNACAAGALPFVSNIELTRIPRRPFRC
jgi:polysaccharide biosynthesis protein PelA